MTHRQPTLQGQGAKACMMGTADIDNLAPVMTMGAFLLCGSDSKGETICLESATADCTPI